MLFYMNSKVFRNNFLRHESDSNIKNAQYVIASTRIHKSREYKNIISAKTILFPGSDVYIGSNSNKSTFRERYFEQLDRCRTFIAFIIKASIEKKHNIIFICTKKEDNTKYLKYLSEYIYIKFGYPCYEYDRYSKGITSLIDYDADKVLKTIKPYIKQGKDTEKKYNLKLKDFRKKYIKKLKKNKSKLIKEVKKIGLYSKKLTKDEMIEIVKDML